MWQKCNFGFFQEDLDSRLKGKKIPPKYWEFPEMEKGNIHKHCAYCVDINCAKSNDVFTSYDDIACNMIECRQVRVSFVSNYIQTY